MPAPVYELTSCVVCGHADAAVVADADAIRREIEELWAYHQRRLRPDTPPERLMDRVAFSQHPALRIVRCRGCGLVYRNPIERPHELEDIYEAPPAEPDLPRTARALHDTQRTAARAQAKRLLAVLGHRGAGLEVGSYVGAFLAAARDEGLRFEGVDVNRTVNGFTRSLGFTVHDGEFAKLPDHPGVDALAIWNTFDQLPDPRATLKAARDLLQPGGVLALRVPNGGAYVAWRKRLEGPRPMRAAARAVLAQNNLLGFPYRFGFTVGALSRLLHEAGFRVVRVFGDVLVPTADAWTRPWARVEEHLLKLAARPLARVRAAEAPWFEIYANPRPTR